MIICFAENAWEDYLYWQQVDLKKVRRINDLLRDVVRTPFTGIGKPEALKHEFQGYWSRRIDEEHRLVYRVEEGRLLIAQCRFHYK